MSDFSFISHGPRGSGPWLMMTALGAALQETSQADSVTVLDLAGRDGTEAIERVAVAAGDELTAGSCTPTYLTTPTKQHLPVTYRDLTPLAGLVSDTYLLATRSGHPRGRVPELFGYPTVAAAAPFGGNTHIQAVLLGDVVPAPVTVIFKPDQAAAIAAVADGDADWTTGVATDFQAGVTAGRLAVIGSFAAAGDDKAGKDSAAPPTLGSAGIPVTFRLWRGLIGPPGLGADARERWDARLRVARSSRAWRSYLDDSELTDLDLPAVGFSALLDEENANYQGWLDRLA
jgi:putative tricarboxylic transport membrane protein